MNKMMKKYVLLLLLGFTCFYMHAQSLNDSIRVIEERITERDSVMNSLKKTELIDSLVNQNKDYRLLNKLLNDQISELSNENRGLCEKITLYDQLTDKTVGIFDLDFDSVNASVPTCLMVHISIIKDIVSLKKIIEKIESKAEELKSQLYDVDPKTVNEVIRAKIESDVNVAQSLIRKIKESNMSSLSTEQKNYFKPVLTERYNNFSKYFE